MAVAEPADPIGAFIADQGRNIKLEQILIEAAKGSVADDFFRQATAKEWLTPTEAEDLLKVVNQFRLPLKPGAKKQLKTLYRIQAIAWLAVHEPTLQGRALAVRLGMDLATLREFRHDHRDIRRAIELLRPDPPVNA